MVRFVIRAVVWLGAAAIGLLVAKALLDGVTISWASFLVVVVIFAILQSVLSPFLTKLARRDAPAVVGGVGLVSTFLALLITDLISSGMSISGLDTWVFATLIVWVATMIATLLLSALFGRRTPDRRRER